MLFAFDLSILYILKEQNMGGLGFPKMVVVLIIALVIFGPNKLPALGEGLGKAIRGFKEGLKDNPKDQPTVKKS
jgi:sec-independent protein translocase protein TatA